MVTGFASRNRVLHEGHSKEAVKVPDLIAREMHTPPLLHASELYTSYNFTVERMPLFLCSSGTTSTVFRCLLSKLSLTTKFFWSSIARDYYINFRIEQQKTSSVIQLSVFLKTKYCGNLQILQPRLLANVPPWVLPLPVGFFFLIWELSCSMICK